MVSLTLYNELFSSSFYNSLDISLYNLFYTYATYVNDLTYVYNISFFNFFTFKTLTFFVIFYFSFFYMFKILNSITDNFDIFSTIFNYFSEVEEEVGSLDDILAYVLVYLSIAVSFLITIFFVFFFKTSTFLIILFNFVLIIPVLTPTFVLKSYGWGFLQYIRGAARTPSLLFESFLDLISTISIYLRFFIQNVRFFFIFLAFFECYEFIYLTIYRDFSLLNIFVVNLTSNNFAVFINNFNETVLTALVIKLFLFFYYTGHLIITFVGQIANYFLLSFWLFFFLYTAFSLEKQETYFSSKRN